MTAFPLRQSLIRMELFVGLLIVLGAILGGSEGTQCYITSRDTGISSMNCQPRDSNSTSACITYFNGNIVLLRTCLDLENKLKQCLEKAFGADPCYSSPQDDQIVRKCEGTETAPTNTTEIPTSQQKVCYCFKNLCNDHGKGLILIDWNPAGRSAPNKQVLFGILMAASLYSFTIGVGSF